MPNTIATRPTLTPVLLILLALLSSFTPLSIDMYLPALPVIAVDLHGTVGDIQLTLSSFMIAFGAGQRMEDHEGSFVQISDNALHLTYFEPRHHAVQDVLLPPR